MTAPPHLTKIENWVGNKTLFEIIKDRNRVDTIIKDIDNKEGHIHIEVLQFANIFSLYQKLDQQRKAIVERISQTDDWEERLKIGEELTKVENEEKQFLKNVLHTAHTFTDTKLQGVLETVAESFFQGNIEQANTLLNTQKLVDSQEKMLQLVKEKLKLEQAYDRLEDNANEFKVKAQLTILNLDISDADDRFEKAVFYFERGLVSARVTERNQLIGDNLFYYAYFLQEHNRENEAVSLYEDALYIYIKN